MCWCLKRARSRSQVAPSFSGICPSEAAPCKAKASSPSTFPELKTEPWHLQVGSSSYVEVGQEANSSPAFEKKAIVRGAPPTRLASVTDVTAGNYGIELRRSMLTERWGFAWESRMLETDGIRVLHKVAPGSLLAEWNLHNPGKLVKPGDRLVAVNGKAGRMEVMTVELSRSFRIVCEFCPVDGQTSAQLPATCAGADSAPSRQKQALDVAAAPAHGLGDTSVEVMSGRGNPEVPEGASASAQCTAPGEPGEPGPEPGPEPPTLALREPPAPTEKPLELAPGDGLAPGHVNVELRRGRSSDRWGYVWNAQALDQRNVRVLEKVTPGSIAAAWNSSNGSRELRAGAMLIMVNGQSGSLEHMTMELARNHIVCVFQVGEADLPLLGAAVQRYCGNFQAITNIAESQAASSVAKFSGLRELDDGAVLLLDLRLQASSGVPSRAAEAGLVAPPCTGVVVQTPGAALVSEAASQAAGASPARDPVEPAGRSLSPTETGRANRWPSSASADSIVVASQAQALYDAAAWSDSSQGTDLCGVLSDSPIRGADAVAEGAGQMQPATYAEGEGPISVPRWDISEPACAAPEGQSGSGADAAAASGAERLASDECSASSESEIRACSSSPTPPSAGPAPHVEDGASTASTLPSGNFSGACQLEPGLANAVITQGSTPLFDCPAAATVQQGAAEAAEAAEAAAEKAAAEVAPAMSPAAVAATTARPVLPSSEPDSGVPLQSASAASPLDRRSGPAKAMAELMQRRNRLLLEPLGAATPGDLGNGSREQGQGQGQG